MFTVCPKCALTLVVTAADLRVAQGYVRCGRCSSVFNALARLSDERQVGTAGDEPAALASPEPTEPAQQADADLSPLDQALTQEDAAPDSDTSAAAEEPIPEGALEFNPDTTDVGAVFVEPPPNPQWTAATGSFKAMRAASLASTHEVAEVPEEPSGDAGEPQVDVEIDAAFMADMLRESAPQSEPQSEAELPEVQ
ncbi:MAG TPA: MJ0042-type zinc finger domain-containing protein, partial [Steroidobacteraceae bacterium]|nr:MJ0042-type zinc finger domain-containing protein [Steroidobacteraceae bacterium]